MPITLDGSYPGTLGVSVLGNIVTDSNVVLNTGNIVGNTAGFTVGYLNVPQVTAGNVTLALTDAGKHYYSTASSTTTLTIPANASVAFATGTAIGIVNQGTGNITVAAASGVTLYIGGNSTAGNRTVTSYGIGSILKVATDTWFITGTNIQ
jgi:hypothetical protein